MSTKFSERTQKIIDRLAALDYSEAKIDKARVELALVAHYEALGLPPPKDLRRLQDNARNAHGDGCYRIDRREGRDNGRVGQSANEGTRMVAA